MTDFSWSIVYGLLYIASCFIGKLYPRDQAQYLRAFHTLRVSLSALLRFFFRFEAEFFQPVPHRPKRYSQTFCRFRLVPPSARERFRDQRTLQLLKATIEVNATIIESPANQRLTGAEQVLHHPVGPTPQWYHPHRG